VPEHSREAIPERLERRTGAFLGGDHRVAGRVRAGELLHPVGAERRPCVAQCGPRLRREREVHRDHGGRIERFEREVRDDLAVIGFGDHRPLDARGPPIVAEPRFGRIRDSGVVLVACAKELHDGYEIGGGIDGADPASVRQVHRSARSKM
jgi:hypothetical protein